MSGNSRRYTAFLLLFLLVLSCGAMVFSAYSFRERIDAARSSDSDNAGWLISQLDVDQKSVLLAVSNALLADDYPGFAGAVTDLSQVRRSFDIFYSRINTVLAALNREDISNELQERLNQLVQIKEMLALEIDSLPEDNLEALMLFGNNVQSTSSTVRDVTTMALFHHVTQSDLVREMERDILRQFWLQSIVLLILMLVSAILAFRLWRELEERSVRMQRVVDTVSKVFDVSLSAIIISDMYGRILLTNPAAAEVFRVPGEEMTGMLIEEVMVPPDQREHHRQGVTLHRQAGHRRMIGAGPTRMDAVRMDGSPFKAEISIMADTDVDGKPILIGFVRDMSDVVAAEEKLMAARDEAHQHASAKTMFLATMSHEMRTPLHGVIASLDLVDDTNLSTETQLLLQTARDCSDRALQQVNDVLEITRLGEDRLGVVAFSPTAVARGILQELGPMAGSRRIELKLDIAGNDTDHMFLGLENAFSRALYNLVGNAVKFTHEGYVCISLRFTPTKTGSTLLNVEVRDSGIGIAKDDQERIFTEFETVGSRTQAQASGTGLGLPIVSLAVSRMGGHITLESEIGKGSTFSFEVLLSQAETYHRLTSLEGTAALPSTAEASTKVLDILVVDDNDVNGSLMCMMVVKIGHHATEARNGLEAVVLASSKAFDIILMDVSMPIMDGREATGLIREGGPSRSAVIIGVTAFSDAERLKDLIQIGMDAVLTKPVNTSELAAAMAQATKNTPSARDRVGKDNGDLSNALSQLEEMMGRDEALRFMRKGLEDVEENLPVLLDTTVPLEKLAERVHSSVGVTAVLGLSELSSLLARAEAAALAGERDAMCDLESVISLRLASEKAILKKMTEDF